MYSFTCMVRPTIAETYWFTMHRNSTHGMYESFKPQQQPWHFQLAILAKVLCLNSMHCNDG